MKRFAIEPPQPDKGLMEELRVFVRKWVRENMVPLDPNSDTSVRAWLDSTNYPLWRKDELLAKWEKIDDPRNLSSKYYKVKSFMKDEVYPEYKHVRAINSRTDEFKCAVGPIFRLIEKELFKLDWFIKKIPVKDRPKFIMDRLHRIGAKYYATDYTAFEALFRKIVMEVTSFELYEYMVQHLPEGKWFMETIRRALAGRNHCQFKNFFVEVDATRMSGEMDTSLGNSFANLMFMLFMCNRHGVKNVVGEVEGDDGLFTGEGNFPTVEDFAKLGLMLKMEQHDDLSSASFCGLVFDPHDQLNVTNPLEVLATFGWVNARYFRSSGSKLKSLLRAKSLSLAYQYPGCPIIAELARYGLRITRSYDVRWIIEKDKSLNMWERQQLLEALRHPIAFTEVPMNTRLLVERLYNIPIHIQRDIERTLAGKDDLLPIKLPILEGLLPQVWKHNFERYVREDNLHSHLLSYPAGMPAPLKGVPRDPRVRTPAQC